MAALPGRMRRESPTGAAPGPAWRRSARICGWSYEREGDIWYRTSTDNGDTWSDETQFTRFVGADYAPAADSACIG